MVDRVYHYLVNRKPNIYHKYSSHRKGRKGIGVLESWLYLLWLNLSEPISGETHSGQQSSKNNVLFKETSESLEAKRESIQELANQCEGYDVISFDVFDTLLFRVVRRPSDSFYFIGERLNIPNFQGIRREAESRMYRLKKHKGQVGEVTLEDIWKLIEKEKGIDHKQGIEAELETEKTMCFANPYMLELLKELKKRNKRLIAVSDMYLGKEQISNLLTRSGISDVFEEIFVSSEWGASKHKGRLYGIVKEKVGQECSYFHIGDNLHADVKQAKKYGFTPYHYPNVNDIGAPYRPTTLSVPAGSIYCGLVNAYIHSGRQQYSKEYELGFIYGGPLLSYYQQQFSIKEEEGNEKQEETESAKIQCQELENNPIALLFLRSLNPKVLQGVEDFTVHYRERMKRAPEINPQDVWTIIQGLESHVEKVKNIIHH